MRRFLPILVIFLQLLSFVAEARPEFAAQYTYVSCTMCHVNPAGGGIRKIEGKLYASRIFAPSEWSKQAWFQFDSRSQVAYAKRTASAERKGVMIMTTTPAVHLPVVKKPSTGQDEVEVVFSHGLGLANTGLMDAYLLFNYGQGPSLKAPTGEKANVERPLHSILVGQFIAPFGLATDEHRTYTRIMTKSTVRDYQSGLLLSGDPDVRFHYDLALSAGLQTASALATDSPWGLYANMRWNPFRAPMFFGMSYAQVGTQKVAYPLEAASMSMVLTTDQATNGTLTGALLAEVTWAHGWNNSLVNGGLTGIGYFIPDTETNWQTALNDSRSLGYLLQYNWNLSQTWQIQLKQEQFIPDERYTGDVFNRTGLGFRHYLNSNMSLTGRVEKSDSTRPGITETGNVRAVDNMAYLLLHLWI